MTMQFFCTAGRGTEDFLIEEVSAIESVSEIQKTDGKIFFAMKDVTLSLLDLKCAERLFIQVLHLPNQQSFHKKDAQTLGKQIADYHAWDNIIRVYKILTTASKSASNNVDMTGDVSPQEMTKTCPCEDNTTEAPPAKKLKTGTITFRISCKLSPAIGKRISTQDVSRAISWHIRQALNWEVDMRRPLLEVCVHISGGTGITVGIPAFSKPLSKRTYLQDFGLRSTVAWIIGHLASIKPGSVVLDPMCGAGTILVEAQRSWPAAHYVGIDLSEDQVWKAKENVDFSKRTAPLPFHIDLLVGDATRLPMTTQSIDALVCDLPFGSKYLTVEVVRKLLPRLLREFDRVLKPGSSMVLLSSSVLKGDLLRQVAALSDGSHKGAPLPEHTPSTGSMGSEVAHDPGTDRSSPTPPVETLDCHVAQDSPVPVTTHSGDHLQKVSESCETIRSSSDTRESPSDQIPIQAWVVNRVHYLKLGETDSHVCLFTKSAV